MKAQTALAIWFLIVGGTMAQAQTGVWMGEQPNPGQAATKREFHGKVARDTQGASYFAMERVTPVPDAPRPLRITITDPAAGTLTILDPQQKTASISHNLPAGAASALPPKASVPGGPTAKPVSSSAMLAASALGTTNAKTEDLGTKTLDGLKVVGSRTTNTAQLPDGKTFVSKLESWTSPDLKVVVLLETSTSNGDHHTTQLTNIVRTEPSADLFKVPAGYTVRDNVPRPSNIQ